MNKTAFQIYKEITKQLELLFPYKEKEIVVRKNPIPDNLEFHKKGISKSDLNKNMNEISLIYYKIFKYFGEDRFYELHENNNTFNYTIREYPDRNINLLTILSILYLSGFKNDELYNRGLNYLLTYGDKNNEKKKT